MAFEFKLPDIGEGVVEGEIVSWLVSEGDAVEEDQPLVEVMTDKATVELTAPRSGRIGSIGPAEGETVKVGSVILTIDEGEGAAAAAGEGPKKDEEIEPPPGERPGDGVDEPPGRREKEDEIEPPPPTKKRRDEEEIREPDTPSRRPGPKGDARVLAMPAVRRLARDLEVDLGSLRGSGPRGRILEEDVKAAAGGAAPRKAAPAAAGAPSRPRPRPTGEPRETRREPFRGMRRKIAEHMSRSKEKAAHFTYVDEADCTRLVELRKRAKPRAEARGIRLTYLAFLAKAVAKAIEDHPVLNASLDEEAEEIVYHGPVHIGIAVDTDKGLIVPVVKEVDRLSVYEIAAEIERLAADAREGRSKLEDLQGSTFTITSVGSLGGMFATPIINYPEVAILGVNRIHERPVVRDGQVVVRHMTYFSLSLDHRIVDGAQGARFMNTFKELVEEPALLFLDALE